MWSSLVSINVLLLAAMASCKDCTYQYLPHKYITIMNSLTSGHRGLLATLYNVEDLKECVRRCSYFEHCHLATYQKRGAIGFCDLYYYHYPAKYKFEAESQIRIVPENTWPISYVIFNINCKRFPISRGTCYSDKFQSQKINVKPIEYVGLWEKTDPKKVLTVDQCASLCNSKALGNDYCAAALFSPPGPADYSLLSNCHRLKGFLPSQVIADIYLKPHEVLVGNAQCTKVEDNCRYEPSKLVFGSVNDLEMPPDIYYGTESEADCAKVCGKYPNCLEAEFVPPTSNESPLCYLYRSQLALSARPTLHNASKKERKIRLTAIQCVGIKKQFSGKNEISSRKSKVSKVSSPSNQQTVAQQLSKFPSRSRNGRVSSTRSPEVTLNLPSRGAKVSGYRLDELIASGGSIPLETNPNETDIDTRVRSTQ